MKIGKKKIAFLFILILTFTFFSFQDNLNILVVNKNLVALKPNINFTNSIFQNYRVLLIEYSTIKFKYAELDLTLKFLFKEKDCQIPSLQQDYEKILNQYSFLFDQQFAAFKYYIVKYINDHKKSYPLKNPRFDDDNYLKQLYKIMIYRDFFSFDIIEGLGFLLLSKEQDANTVLKENLLTAFFNERNDSFLYYTSKMFMGIPQINAFYEKYINALNDYFIEYEFENIYDFICTSFNIKSNKSKKLIVNIFPVNYINIKEKDGKFNPLEISKVEDFYPIKIFGYMTGKQMLLGLESFLSKKVFLEIFTHELIHYFQYYSSFIYDEIGKMYYNTFAPKNYKSIGEWNKYISSFKDIEKYSFSEFDAVFTSLYLSKLYAKKYPEKWDVNDRENCLSENRIFFDDFYNYLLMKYLDFCKANNIVKPFYALNCDASFDNSDKNFLYGEKNSNNENAKIIKENLTNFFKNWVYPNRDKILYDIYRATKYFQSF